MLGKRFSERSILFHSPFPFFEIQIWHWTQVKGSAIALDMKNMAARCMVATWSETKWRPPINQYMVRKTSDAGIAV
jgi:hypothetical protein